MTTSGHCSVPFSYDRPVGLATSGGRAAPRACSMASKSWGPSSPASCRRRATSRAICNGASTTTVTLGKLCCSKWVHRASCACHCWRVIQAQALKPASCAASKASRPQRAGRHWGCSSSTSAVRRSRCQPGARNLDCSSNWARFQSPASAWRQWLAGSTSSARACKRAWTQVARAGSACTVAGLSSQASGHWPTAVTGQPVTPCSALQHHSQPVVSSPKACQR